MKIGRKMSQLGDEERESIYNLYEFYEAFKNLDKSDKSDYLFDSLDLSWHVYSTWKSLENENNDSSFYNSVATVNRIIHDEVQDCAQSMLRLNFLLSSCPNQIMFAGDTCQTISQGVNFRFADLKSIFHYENEIQRKGDSSYRIKIPTIHQLTTNYRSHAVYFS